MTDDVLYNINEAYNNFINSLYRYLGGARSAMSIADLGKLYGTIEDAANHMEKCREIIHKRLQTALQTAQDT